MLHTPATVWINETVIREMTFEANRAFPLETGGILMGYCAEYTNEIVVSFVIGPGARALHKRHSFMPDAIYQEAQVALHYVQSGCTVTYLGDWHTHPLGRAHLSHRDKQTLRQISNSPDARAPSPIMTVLSGGDPGWNLTSWQLTRRRFGRLIGLNGVNILNQNIYSEY